MIGYKIKLLILVGINMSSIGPIFYFWKDESFINFSIFKNVNLFSIYHLQNFLI